MKAQKSVLLVLTSLLAFCACKKDQKADGCSAPTTRIITNKTAIIKVNATIYQATITELGSIDTWLIPCNLPQEFYQNDLQVVISGEAKDASHSSGICCPEYFFITKISR